MADEDKQIDIKKRARRRLVGAAALALFAVIVLPMVMDSEPRHAERDIEVRIPPQSGANVLARSIDDKTPAAEQPEPAEAGVAGPDAAAEVVREAAVAEAKPAGRTPPPPAPKDEPARSSERKSPAVAANPSPERKPSKQGAPVDDGARAAAILAGRSPDTLSEPPFFVVQLGAYRDRSNAISLHDKLRADGFSSFTEKAGDKTRVRVGPFAQRADAEAALSRLKRLGLRGTVLVRD